MKLHERTAVDQKTITELRERVAQGEGLFLEFKRKASFPEKIIKEIIAFANTEGGTLLVGVDDDGSIPGVKYPEEEIHVIEKALQKHARPLPEVVKKIVALNPKKFVVLFDIPRSERRPHRLVFNGQPAEIYVRIKAESVKASRELQEIVRRSKSAKDIKFTYGPHESTLLKYLEMHPQISLSQFCRITKLNRFMASRKLITLVLARVIKIIPGHPDQYTRM